MNPAGLSGDTQLLRCLMLAALLDYDDVVHKVRNTPESITGPLERCLNNIREVPTASIVSKSLNSRKTHSVTFSFYKCAAL